MMSIPNMKTKVPQNTVKSKKLLLFTGKQIKLLIQTRNICIVIAISKGNPRCLSINLVDTLWMMLHDLLIVQNLAEWWLIVSMRIVAKDQCSWSDNFTFLYTSYDLKSYSDGCGLALLHSFNIE